MHLVKEMENFKINVLSSCAVLDGGALEKCFAGYGRYGTALLLNSNDPVLQYHEKCVV